MSMSIRRRMQLAIGEQFFEEFDCGTVEPNGGKRIDIPTKLTKSPDFAYIRITNISTSNVSSDSALTVFVQLHDPQRGAGNIKVYPGGATYPTSQGILFNNGIITFYNWVGLSPKFSTAVTLSDGTTVKPVYTWFAGRLKEQ